MFLSCPAYLDSDGAARCGLPAEVDYWYTLESSAGALESVKIRCPRDHWFNGPVEYLAWRPGSRPPRSFPQLLPGEEHIGVVTAAREHEVDHVVTVVAPGEVVVSAVNDIGDVIAHVSGPDNRIELRDRQAASEGARGHPPGGK